MREIKFRVWDGKTMWYRGSLQFDMMPFELTKKTFFEFEGVESGEIVVGKATRLFEVMQYTGLKDKTGKEIYEGDIVRFLGPVGNVLDMEVVFKDGCFCRYNHFTMHIPLQSLTRRTEYEVIGNKYENPELLKKEIL
jgi:uncharacterized phage protein (TIGR01671 family)